MSGVEFGQQVVNGVSLGSIYALIALGYTMVYGVLRFINFAHGDVFMLGAFSGLYLTRALSYALPSQSLRLAISVLLLSMAICAVLGILIERLAYRPLRDKPKLSVLITAIGVSLLIEYVGQHPSVFTPSPHTFPTLLPSRNFQIGTASSALVINSTEVIVLAITAFLLLVLQFIVHRTKLGTAMRAVSFNAPAAALDRKSTRLK